MRLDAEAAPTGLAAGRWRQLLAWLGMARHTAVVAEVDVQAGIGLRSTAPHLVALLPGERLRLVCAYRLQADAAHHERFAVRFRVALEGEDSVLRERRMEEGLLRRRGRGRLSRTLRFRLPGIHVVRWSAEAEYEVEHWGSGQPMRVERERTAGLLRIEVLQPAPPA